MAVAIDEDIVKLSTGSIITVPLTVVSLHPFSLAVVVKVKLYIVLAVSIVLGVQVTVAVVGLKGSSKLTLNPLGSPLAITPLTPPDKL